MEPQPFSFSKKRAYCCTDTREEMRYEGSQVITPPLSRRRMTPPTPVQNSYTSLMRDHGRYEEGGRGWNVRERTIIARTKQYLERSFSVKVRVEELEGLLGPEDDDVDFRRILKEARDERARKIFEIFSSDDLSLLVAEWSRWDKYKRAPWRHDSSASARDGWQASLGQPVEQTIVGWSQDEQRVMDAVEDCLERCAQVIVKINLVESLLRPEYLDVSLRYVLKHATHGGSNLPAEVTVHGRRTGDTSGTTLGIKEPRQKLHRAPTCPNSTLQTPLPQRKAKAKGCFRGHAEIP